MDTGSSWRQFHILQRQEQMSVHGEDSSECLRARYLMMLPTCQTLVGNDSLLPAQIRPRFVSFDRDFGARLPCTVCQQQPEGSMFVLSS
jgi:hypothetical protein